MSSLKQRGARRLSMARSRGQSLPLIGLMVVILVAMVGLSVDVGNTFQNERKAVAAGNAASLAGMNSYVRRTSSTTNQVVYDAIRNSLSSNGISVAAFGTSPSPGQVQLEAYYLDAQGRVLSPGGTIDNSSERVPNNVAYIQVKLSGVVNTFFARVVGRPDLPINASAYAGTCPSGQGYYPIGVNNKLLEGNKFKNPGDVDPVDGTTDDGWRTLTSGTYAGYTAMRMDVQDGPSSGGFSWLRWMDSTPGAKSSPALESSLSIPGNLSDGFEEATWPDPASKPDDYPTQPGILNRGDWIWATTGYRSNADPIMNLHVSEGTRMILPIYDSVVGQGVNARYQVVDFGIFVVLSHGKMPQGNEKYIELVFLGRNTGQDMACSFSTAPEPSATYELLGDVSIRPEYAYNPTSRKPVQYVVVLDVSGSMSANFAGQCNRNRWNNSPPSKGYWQCANGPDGAPSAEVGGTGPDYWWGNQDERRITVAKRALESLVRSTNMPGNSGYDNTRPDDQMAIVWFNASVDKGNSNITVFGSSNFTNQVGDSNSGLIRAINRAGWRNSDPYRTEGGTNGAAGLYRAALAFDGAPKDITLGSTKYDYKRVVVFLTDGVSNQFLNKGANDLLGGASSTNTYPNGHACRVSNVAEIATCQVTGTGSIGGGKTTGIGGVAAGMDRPITQAGLVSKEDLQPKGIEVYAIALSNIPDTGLKDTIASFPSYFFSAATLEVSGGTTNVDKIMEVINTRVEAGLCTPRSDVLDGNPEWRSTIPPDHFQATGGLVYPNVGEVIISGENGTFRIPILADPATGKLTYRKTNVPKGSYKLTPYLFYRHPLDPAGTLPRIYSTILQADQRLPDITINIPEGTVGMSAQVKKDIQLLLTGDVCKK